MKPSTFTANRTKSAWPITKNHFILIKFLERKPSFIWSRNKIWGSKTHNQKFTLNLRNLEVDFKYTYWRGTRYNQPSQVKHLYVRNCVCSLGFHFWPHSILGKKNNKNNDFILIQSNYFKSELNPKILFDCRIDSYIISWHTKGWR